MTPDHLHILQHTLGLDEYGRGTMYRNYYATAPSCDSFAACQELVTLGYMEDSGPEKWAGDMHYFYVTPLGKIAIREFSPLPPKLTRAQQGQEAHSRRRHARTPRDNRRRTGGRAVVCRRTRDGARP